MTDARLDCALAAEPLRDYICRNDVLHAALLHVLRRRRPAPAREAAVDRLRRNQDAVLREIQNDVSRGRFVPEAMLVVRIAKSGGGIRALAVPTLRDQIVQSAIARRLTDTWDVSFSARSFAYRPGRSPRDAAHYLLELLHRDAWILTVDIKRFFDTVDHTIIAQLLRERGLDEADCRLVLSLVAAPAIDHGQRLYPLRGLPQGSALSPILANLYLDGFDSFLEERGVQHVRFADDFIIVDRLASRARATLTAVAQWLAAERRLAIAPEKTSVQPAGRGTNFVGFDLAPGRARIPEAKLLRFRTAIIALGELLGEEPWPEFARRHNALVNGFAAFYRGMSREIGWQLRNLERWRIAELRGAAVTFFDVPPRHLDQRSRAPPSRPTGESPRVAASRSVERRLASLRSLTNQRRNRRPRQKRQCERNATMIVSGYTYRPAPEGLRDAVCVDVVDLGEMDTRFGRKPMLRLTWEVESDAPDCPPLTISRTYTRSLHEKSSLHRDLKTWRGKPFSVEELQGFDLEGMIGVPCKLMIQHEDRGGTIYAKVTAVTKADPRMPMAPSGQYVRVCDRAANDKNDDGRGEAA